jgi:hypothetical protein
MIQIGLLIGAVTGLCGCRPESPSDPNSPATRPAEPPPGWSIHEVRLNPPVRVFLGAAPESFSPMERDRRAYDRLDARLVRQGPTEKHITVWEDGPRAYAVARDAAVVGARPIPADVPAHVLDRYVSDGKFRLLAVDPATNAAVAMTETVRTPVDGPAGPGYEVVLDGPDLRIVLRVQVKDDRAFVTQVSQFKRDGLLDPQDPKVRAFLDRSGPVAGG